MSIINIFNHGNYNLSSSSPFNHWKDRSMRHIKIDWFSAELVSPQNSPINCCHLSSKKKDWFGQGWIIKILNQQFHSIFRQSRYPRSLLKGTERLLHRKYDHLNCGEIPIIVSPTFWTVGMIDYGQVEFISCIFGKPNAVIHIYVYTLIFEQICIIILNLYINLMNRHILASTAFKVEFYDQASWL